MQNYDLQAKFDSRNSFYGKARVEESDDQLTLTSYSTKVAKIFCASDGEPLEAEVYGTYSQTTLRHIKEFLKQHGFKAENSKQIMADYGTNN
jgi:hypothetical protein